MYQKDQKGLSHRRTVDSADTKHTLSPAADSIAKHGARGYLVWTLLCIIFVLRSLYLHYVYHFVPEGAPW